MFCLKNEDISHFRILIVIILLIGVFYLFSSKDKVSLKNVIVKGETQVQILSDNEVLVTQTGKVSPEKVIINESPFEDLLSCPGIGKNKASRIVEERKKSLFSDWQDFQNRIKGISNIQIDVLKDAGVKLYSGE